MIERIKGAMVTYITDDFKPVHKDDATLVKIVHDDGRVTFARPVKDDKEKHQS